jgi:hypothetical protein
MRRITTTAAFLAILALRPGFAASHHVKLAPFITNQARSVGLVVSARLNGGNPVDLLLDSGAQTIVLDRRTAVRGGFAGGADWDLVSPGAPAAIVKEASAASVQVGDLTLNNVPVLIVDRQFGDGIHGVLPLALFDGFLIRLDVPGRSLDLLPYPSDPPEAGDSIHAVANHQLLFLDGRVNGSQGYFLLDTGASYNAISPDVVRRLHIPDAFAPRVALRGGAEIDAPLIDAGLNVRFGAREMAMAPLVAVDFSTASRYHGLEVAGLVGYPALRDSVVTVNYRDALVQLMRPNKGNSR